MGFAFHQLCPRYSGTLTPTAPTAIRLWDTFTFTLGDDPITRVAPLINSSNQSRPGLYFVSSEPFFWFWQTNVTRRGCEGWKGEV